MGRTPNIVHDGAGSCGDCKHGSDYIPYLSSSRYAATVKCVLHNCRVYALGGRCVDYKEAKGCAK